MSIEDRGLVQRMAQGDRSAFEALYDRYSSMTYAVILRILKNPTDAEECLQDVWVEAWNRAGRYDGDRGAVGAWLLTLARSRALDRYRSRRSRHKAVETGGEFSAPAAAPDPSLAPEATQLHSTVTGALGQLEDHHRTVLTLAYWEGLSQSEIAKRIDAPLGTVKSWTRQALSHMNGMLPREDWS